MAKILIVEDNDMLNQAYTFMLSTKGHQVESAYDGEEGILKAKLFKPEIILLDYIMPKMDGQAFLKKYNGPKNNPDVQIVLLTNLSDNAKIDEALTLGVKKYCLKAKTEPFQLIAVIDELLKI
ncbi:MAG: response regulator [Candidatus Saccharimonadales bacterium]